MAPWSPSSVQPREMSFAQLSAFRSNEQQADRHLSPSRIENLMPFHQPAWSVPAQHDWHGIGNPHAQDVFRWQFECSADDAANCVVVRYDEHITIARLGKLPH